MRCRRQGRVFSSLASTLFVRGCLALSLLAGGMEALADSTIVYDPFEVPQGAYQATHVEDVDNVSIIEFAGNYDKELPGGETNAAARAVVAREFYRTHSDDYDFLVVFTGFEFETGEATAFYNPVRNDTQGIGLPQFDLSSIYGSDGKLQGYVDMAALSRYEWDPLKPDYERGLLTLAHEFFHRWGVFVQFIDEQGELNNSLLGHQDAHWSFKVDSSASVQYGHDWHDHGDGSFKAHSARRFFSPMDLYLMGLYGPDEVEPFYFIESEDRAREELPQPGVSISGVAKEVTVGDIIAAEGPRIPAADASQKEFKFAFIYLKSASEEVDASTLLALKRFRENFVTRLSILTGGRSVANVYPQAKPLGDVGESPVLESGELRNSGTSVPEALTWLRNSQSSEGYWEDQPATRLRDTALLLDTLTTYDPSFKRINDAESWLLSQEQLDNDSLARRFEVRRSGDGRQGELNALLEHRNGDGGWGVRAGYQSDVMDTSLVLKSAAPYLDVEVKSAAVEYLLAQQGLDGGWPTVEESTSQITVTAMAMDALREAGVGGDPILRAVEFLKQRQLPDGGFGTGSGTVHDTAHVILSLLHAGYLEEIDVGKAAGFLAGQQSISGDWNGSVYSTALAVSALQAANFANWLIAEVQADPESPRDGERVKFSVIIENDGREPTDATVLRVHEGNSVDPASVISEDIVVPSIPPRNAAAVDFYWDSMDNSGERTFTFAVDPDDSVVERSELDNLKTLSINVREAPEGIDLELNDGAIAVTPESPYYLPSDLSISISVRNAGTDLADDALVRLFRIENGAEPVAVGEKVVSIPPRQTSVVNFVDRLEVPGTTRYQAVVDPESAIEEADETNNTGTSRVTPRETIDFVVNESSISMQPLTAFVNEDAEFTVVVRNQGTLPAPPSTVRYTLVSEGQEQVLRTNNIVLDAAEAVVQTLNWRVDTAGPKQLVVEMDPNQSVSETDEENNRYVFPFEARVLEGTNVGVRFSDISVSPDPLLEGYGATLSAEVRNNGTETVNGVNVRFFSGNPADGGSEIGATTLGTINASDRVVASVVWSQITGPAKKLIYVQVDPADEIVEFDETDNIAFQEFDVKALPDFVLGSGSLTVTPGFPKQGQVADVQVSLNNAGTQAGEDVVVKLYEGDPLSGGRLLGSKSIAEVAGQESASVRFDYQFGDAVESVRLVATVNEDRTIQEKDYTNNRAERLLSVQNNDFHVSESFISPDGDGVKDESRFSFRLERASDVIVAITNNDGREVRRYAGDNLLDVESATITWDGRNDFGGIVNDDEYTLTVMSRSGAALGSSAIHVDTNRSSLLKASNTPYGRMTDLRDIVLGDKLGNYGGFHYSNGDEFVFFSAFPFNSDNSEGYVNGMYRATAYGGDLTALVDYSLVPELQQYSTPSEGPLISPLTDTLVFRTNKNVWSVDVKGGPLRRLLSVEDLSNKYADWEKLFYSYDGVWLYYFDKYDGRLQLGRIRVDGSGEPQGLAVLDNYSYVREIWRSPIGDQFFALLGSNNEYDLIHFDPNTFEPTLIAEYGNGEPDIEAVAWSPDGSQFAVGDGRFAALQLLSPSGSVIEKKTFFAGDPRFDIRHVRWNPNNLELAYEIRRVSAEGEGALGDNLCDFSTYEPVSGIYIWNTATGKNRRPIAVTEQDICNPQHEGFAFQSQAESARFADFESDYYTDEEDQFWIYAAPEDWEWSPGERRIIVLPRYGQVLVAADVENSGEFEEVFKDWQFGFISDISISPTGRRILFRSGGIAFESLLNLALDVRALGSRAVGGVQLSGTAADLNFDHYELDYSASGASPEWKTITPDSLIPLVDQEMTVWVPPAPGSYYVRLTGEDKAGNIRQSIRRTSWGDQSALTDLYRDPGYISPNGDGVQDVTNLHMRVLQPVNLALEVINESGQVVRTIRRSFDLIGAQEKITWDGRDDFGTVVADGTYELKLGKYRYSVIKDSTPPAIVMPSVADLLSQECNPRVCLVALDLEVGYSFEEENYYRYFLQRERSDGDGWVEFGYGNFDPSHKNAVLEFAVTSNTGGRISSLDMLGLNHRLVVEDLAGNRSVQDFNLSPKKDRAILHTGIQLYDEEGDVTPFDDIALIFAKYDEFPLSYERLRFDWARFTLVESVQSTIESVSLLYREESEVEDRNENPWRELGITHYLVCPDDGGAHCGNSERIRSEGEIVDNRIHFAVDLSLLNKSSAYQVKAKLIDKNGVVYTTNGFKLEDSGDFQIDDIDDQGEGSYWIKTSITNPPFDVAEEFLRVWSADDPRYLEKTRIDLSERTIPPTYSREVSGFFIDSAISCGDYNFEYVLVDRFGNEEVSDVYSDKLGCNTITYTIVPVLSDSCDAEPPRQLKLSAAIRKSPSDLDVGDYQVLAWEMLKPGDETPKVLHTVNNPTEGRRYDFTLDTATIPEGVYDVSIRAVYDSGKEIAETLKLPVDHTPPEVSILSPEPEGKVCATQFYREGGALNGALINADIIDAGGAALEYRVTYQTGSGLVTSPSDFMLDPSFDRNINNLVLTTDPEVLEALYNPDKYHRELLPIRYAESRQPAFSAPARQTPSGNLKALGDVGLIALNKSRDVSFNLAVTDFGGYLQCASQSFYLDASIEGYKASTRSNIISPNGDGVFDLAVIDLGLDEDVTASLAIQKALMDPETGRFTPTGESLFHVEQDIKIGAGITELEWDGTDGSEVVADGSYFMVLQLQDACGNTEEGAFLLKVDSTPPLLSIHYPQQGDPVSLNAEVMGSVADANLVSYRLEYQIAGDDSWAFISDGRTNVAESLLGTWNTFGLQGDVTLRLTATDQASNKSEAVQSLTIEERTDLLSYVDLSSRYISPNADSVLDSVRLNAGTLDAVTIELNLRTSDGTLVSNLVAGEEAGEGEYSYSWRGESAGEVVEDGAYKLEIIARSQEFAGLQQIENATIIVDTLAPTVVVRGIEDGFALAGITASVSDLHLDQYAYYKADDPDAPIWREVVVGAEPVANELFEPLSPGSVEEGNYGLRLVARDKAGNHSEVVRSYIVDFTPPQVEVIAPAADTVTGALLGTLEVVGSIEDQYFEGYSVSYQSVNGTPEQELFNSSSLPASNTLAEVNVEQFVEGQGAIIVEAWDKSGQITRKEVAIVVDNTAPDVQLSGVVDGSFITGTQPILGSVQDENLESYVVEIAPGHDAANDAAWINLIQGTREVSGGNLAYLSDLPTDGAYSLRLRAKDVVGHESDHAVNITVDATPPAAPILISLDADKTRGVDVTWDPVSDPDLDGYFVKRAGSRLNDNLLSAPVFLDTLMADGTYEYQVVAVDLAGNQSEPSNAKTVRIDSIPPQVALSNPIADSINSGLVNVRGTAFSEDDFAEYELAVGLGAEPQAWQVLVRSPLALQSSELAQWDTLNIADGSEYTLRLKASDLTGNVAETRVLVAVDNTPPAAPTDLLANGVVSDVELSWAANSETDFAGYYLFSEGSLVNADAAVVGDMSPYLLNGTTYLDEQKPDGTYQYYVYAADTAGNVSESSEPAEVTLETQAPHVEFERPGNLDEFENTLSVLADANDQDISDVEFVYRAKDALEWTVLESVSGNGPYSLSIDTTSFAYGGYEVSAVATDVHGNVDANPEVVEVSKVDLTRPAKVVSLLAAVDGAQVNLSWQESSDSDLAGYFVDRTSESGDVLRLNAQPVSQTQLIDQNVDDDRYQYAVYAVDLSGNESEVSDTADALVYTPILTPIFTPTTQSSVVVSGTGSSDVSGTAELTVENIVGTQAMPPVVLGDESGFEWSEVTLQPGENVIGVRVSDEIGNRSKIASLAVLHGQAPAAPRNLNASADNSDVGLTWDENAEPNILGYLPYRQDEVLIEEVLAPIESAEGESLSSGYAASKALDGITSTYFLPRGDWATKNWGDITFTLSEPSLVSGFEIENAYSTSYHPDDFDIEVWTGSQWQPMLSVVDGERVDGNVEGVGSTSGVPNLRLSKPYQTDRLRIVFTDPCSHISCRVGEFRVYRQPVLDTTAYTALDQGNGIEVYTVTAINDLGQESPPSDPAETAVGDVVAPEPVNLTGEVVDDRSGDLSWDLSSSSDVAAYRLYRDGELLVVRPISHTNYTSYTDASLKNGSYIYHVVVEDDAGNLSPSSNKVSLEISAPVESRPENLTVAPVPEGRELTLSWAHANPDSVLFRVYRATSISGPFELVFETENRSVQDRDLINGQEYFYRVTATDGFGNEGPSTDAVVGVPEDTIAPLPPSLFFPVTAGEAKEVYDPAMPVVGFAEPGAQVAVFLQGNLASLGVANPAPVTHEYPSGGAHGAVSPDASKIVTIRSRRFVVEGVKDGAVWSDNVDPNMEDVVWMGSETAVGLPYGYEYQYRDKLVLIDAAAETWKYVELQGAESYEIERVDYSPERDKLILLVESYDQENASGVWVVNPESFVIEDIVPMDNWGNRENTMMLNSSGSVVVWDDSTINEIGRLDLVSGERTSLGERVAFHIGWNPAGNALVFSAGSSSVAILDPETGVKSPLALDGISNIRSVHWVREERIIIATIDEIYEYDLETSSAKRIYQSDDYYTNPRDISWSGERGVLGIVTYDYSYIVELGGRFETADIGLIDGENRLFAIAQDESGNESDPTQISTLTYRLSDKPDLNVELFINPNVPVAGTGVDMEVRISNLGQLPAPESVSSISVIGPDGDVSSLWSGKSLPPLAVGASIVKTIPWKVPDLAGTYNMVATVDDDQVIDEVSEGNNSAIKSFKVVNDGGVDIKVSLDRETYGSRQDLTGAVEIVNPSESLDASLSAWIEDENGYEVVSLVSQTGYSLPASSVIREMVSWNTGTVFAGEYSLVAQVGTSDAGVLSESRSDFVIEPEVNPVLAVKSNRGSYGPNESVSITSFISNEEANSPLRDLELAVRVVNESGQTLFEERTAVSELNPSDVQSQSVTWNTGNTAPGDLSITSELLNSSDEILASATNQISVKAGAPVLPAVLNTVSRVPVGTSIVPGFAVSNAGNGIVANLELMVSLVGLDDDRLISSQTFEMDLDRAETFEGQAVFQTADLPLGEYRVLLTAGYQHDGILQSEVLDTRVVNLFDADAPQVTILSPTSGSVVNGNSAKVAVSVEDRLSGVKFVEARVDGGAWVALPPAMVNYYLDLAGVPEGAHVVSVRSSDIAGNISVPVSIDFTIDNQIPGITIEGVEPGGYYPAGVSPVVRFEDAAVTRLELNSEAFVSGSVVDLEGAHRLFAYAEDEAGNSVREAIEFIIDKTSPSIAIEGVSDMELYAEPVTIDITVTETYLDSSEILLNEMPYRSGEEISETGEYSLVVTASDKAGNSTRETRVFEIDTEAPEKPEVTNLSDGDIIDENRIPVVGIAEPRSVIDLEVGGALHTTIVDDTGSFRFDDLSLEDGVYVVTLTATDRAGNVSEETRLTITVRGKTQLDLKGKVTARSHVLVWIPEHPGHGKGRGWHSKENEFDNLLGLIGSAYDQSGTDYQIVRNESDFVTALRSQRFNVLMIGSLKPALGHPLKMSYSTELEIRGVVGAGTGLVWINNHTNLFELWHDVIGARSFGALPHVQNIHLDDGPASSEGAWEYDGRHGVRVVLTGGIGVGQLELECKPHWHLWRYYSDCGNHWWRHDDEHKNPALVINKYGAGSVAMFTFNPGELVEIEQARTMITEVTSYAAPLSGRLFDEGIVDIEWTINGTEQGQHLGIMQSLSEHLELVSAQGGEIIDPNTARWSRTALSSEVTIASQVRLGEDNAEGTVNLSVYDGTIGAGTLLAEETLDVMGQQGRSEMELGYMEAIESIDYSVLEYWPVHKAMLYAQSAVSRDLSNRAQLEWAIWDIKKSIAWLGRIDRLKAANAIVSGGQLLQYYQALWYQTVH